MTDFVWDGPTNARYYGEVVFGGEDWTDYNYGFTNEDVEESDVDQMAPADATIISRAFVDREGWF